MKKLLAILLAVLCIAALTACGADSGDTATGDEATQAPTQAPTQEETQEPLVELTTPYAVLKVRESFEKNVAYEVTGQDPYILTFVTKEDGTELFSLIFNGTGDILLGTIVGEEANTVLYMNMAELDPDSEQYQTNLLYQDAINDILSGLSADYSFVINEVVEFVDSTTFDIETSVVTLHYPNRWKDIVTVDVTDEGAKFSAQGTPIFDVMFTDSDGHLLGTYKGTPIYIVEYDTDSDEQIEMKEDINVILQYLLEDPNFSVNG